jgi:hypothetical protein
MISDLGDENCVCCGTPCDTVMNVVGDMITAQDENAEEVRVEQQMDPPPLQVTVLLLLCVCRGELVRSV